MIFKVFQAAYGVKKISIFVLGIGKTTKEEALRLVDSDSQLYTGNDFVILNPDGLTQADTMGASDNAMQAKRGEYGGINLNPALLDLQIKRDGNGVPLPVNQQQLQNIHIEGFMPIIILLEPSSGPGVPICPWEGS